jgi:hypothetical protein
MRLDRNITTPRRGKYALIKLREHDISEAVRQPGIEGVMVSASAIDLGDTAESDFFVIRLRDKYAANALHAYSASCRADDPEFSREVLELANKAARMQNKQKPT